MNPETVSNWLLNPQRKPAPEMIAQFVTTWPWFAPGRLMELCRQDAEDPLVLDRLRIYAPEWLSAYLAVTAPEKVMTEAPKALFDISAGPKSDAAPIQFPTFSLVTEDVPEEDAPSKEPQIPIQPLFSDDYFKSQGLDTDSLATILPEQIREAADPRTLMIVMSFSEWLNHFKLKREKEDEEVREQRALKSMWQREKLAAALEEEPDEIPEQVFEMAVSSISREDGLVSESLAEVLEKQEKWTQAAEMYRKLGLRNPAKSTYFASRAEAAKKNIS